MARRNARPHVRSTAESRWSRGKRTIVTQRKKKPKKTTLAAYQDTPATEGDSLSCDLLVSSRLLVCLATTTGAHANTLTSICSNSLLEEEEEEGREGYSASSWLLAVNQDIKLGSCDFWRRLMRLELMVVS